MSKNSNKIIKIHTSFYPKSEKEKYYSNLTKAIYQDNKILKEKIKMNIAKPTDPILQRRPEYKEESKVSQKRINNQNRVDNKSDFTEKVSSKKILVSKSVDYLKTSYNMFFEKDKEKRNQKAVIDITRSKKSSKKMFDQQKNLSVIEDDRTLETKKSKKYFPTSASIINIISPVNILARDKIKDHFINSNGGVLAAKKHYACNITKPSENTVKNNDKRKLLNFEYYENINRPHTRAVSVIPTDIPQPDQTYENKHKRYGSLYLLNKQKNESVTKVQDIKYENKPKPSIKIKSYPYVRDNVKEIFKFNSESLKNIHQNSKVKDYVSHNDSYTPKINNNQFDILKKVPKFEWE